MTKTPEQLAEEFINHVLESQCDCSYRIAFLAGYKAGQEHPFQFQAKMWVDPIGPQYRWISVKERLPEEGQVVLVAMPKGTVTLGVIRKKTQAWDVFLDMAIWTAEPTYWMPLPNPPEEEK